jgi:NAD(P)-dependent dehydrogenase (short-subunit alcohol dehydrogenase family)
MGEVNVCITGASRGLGRALTKYLVQECGCRVFAVSRDAARMLSLKEECGSGLEFLVADLMNPRASSAISEWLSDRIESLDILYNNAGYLVNKPIEDMREPDFDRMIHVNYKAPYFLTQALLPLLRKGNKKHIVNIGSMGGVQGSAKFAGLSVYSSSKGAISILTECLAEELKGEGISVNCLALGSVQTEMLAEAFPGYKAEMSAELMAELVGVFGLEWGKGVSGKVIPLAKVSV